MLLKRKLLLLALTVLLFCSACFPPLSMLANASNSGISPLVTINEIEVNAGKGSEEPFWLELFNAGKMPVSLSNMSLIIIDGNSTLTNVLLRNSASAGTLAAHNHYVVSLPINLNHSNSFSLQLFEGGELLDEVHVLNDNIGDGRTWQRYPNGLDTDHFEDWVFAESTRGGDNGNMGKAIAECYLDPFCMTLDVPRHATHILRVNNTTFAIDTFSTSSVVDLDLDREEKKLVVKLAKSARDSGLSFIHLTFPETLLSGSFLVNIDGDGSQKSFFTVTNGTHSRVIIEYEPGDRTVEIVGTNVVPEFGSLYILPVITAITVGSTLGWKRAFTTRFRG